MPIAMNKDFASAPGTDTAQTFILFFCDRAASAEELKLIKRKTKGKIYQFAFDEMLNRELRDVELDVTCQGFSSIMFNMSDTTCREWVSRNIHQMTQYIRFVITSASSHKFIKSVKPDLQFKWKQLGKMEYRMEEGIVNQIESLPAPQGLLRRIVTRLIRACFSSFLAEPASDDKAGRN